MVTSLVSVKCLQTLVRPHPPPIGGLVLTRLFTPRRTLASPLTPPGQRLLAEDPPAVVARWAGTLLEYPQGSSPCH